MTDEKMGWMPISDINDLDAVVYMLGIEDSDTTPAAAVAELQREIIRLRLDISSYRDALDAKGLECEGLRAALE